MASNAAVATTATTAPPKPLAMMTKLSPFVSIYEPTKTKGAAPSASSDTTTTTTTAITTAAAAAAPKLILVAAWMDARDPHIAKYIIRYQTLYPTSKILLVKFILRHIVWASECVRAVQPAVTYLRSQVDSGQLSPSPEKPEVLVHVFSNGGVASTRYLFEEYERAVGRPFPLHTAVYDSCPGLYSYWGAYNASITGVPPGIMRWIMAPLIHLLDMYLWVMAVLLRRPYNLVINAGWHNDPARTRQAGRAYVYGRGDEMVDWRHVEMHARQAEEKGYAVRRELFEDSTHVAHVRADEARYWRVVRETWEKGVLGGGGGA